MSDIDKRCGFCQKECTKRCQQCLFTYYCDKKCQKQHLKDHINKCNVFELILKKNINLISIIRDKEKFRKHKSSRKYVKLWNDLRKFCHEERKVLTNHQMWIMKKHFTRCKFVVGNYNVEGLYAFKFLNAHLYLKVLSVMGLIKYYFDATCTTKPPKGMERNVILYLSRDYYTHLDKYPRSIKDGYSLSYYSNYSTNVKVKIYDGLPKWSHVKKDVTETLTKMIKGEDIKRYFNSNCLCDDCKKNKKILK